jgi:alpha-beta hydrolase superfamily lysophospholipase
MLPVIIVSAEQDRLVKNAAQERVAGLLPYGIFAPIAGAEHEILMESDPIRRQFWENFDGLAGRVAPIR